MTYLLHNFLKFLKFYGFLVFTILLSSQVANAQLFVSNAPPYNNQNHLVQNILLGQNVTATNITYNYVTVPAAGIPTNAMGFFHTQNWLGGTPFAIDSGIIMTTGTITNALGPNQVTGQGTANNLIDDDPDLNAISGVQTRDGSILEFDFVPISDTIKFNYFFGSEEYPEFVGGGVNDAFGFFLSGPGISGPFSNSSINIALIPNTTIPVSINTVNGGANSAFYVDNTGGQNMEYDGFTTILEARSVVTPCQTYHIKLAIADGGDRILDSGVFLEAKSFSGTTFQVETTPTYTQIGNDTNLYEGCGLVTLTIRRFVDFSNQHTIQIIKGGTALDGIDYTSLPDSITFPVGADTVQIPFTVINDQILEGPENIALQFISPGVLCLPDDTQNVNITINDPIPLNTSVTAPDTITCTQDNIQISASVSTGLNGYTFSWNDGGSTSTIFRSPDTTTTYIVTITDGCGIYTEIDTITTVVETPPFGIDVYNDTINCAQTAAIGAFFTQNYYPEITYQWSNGANGLNQFVSPDTTTNYFITATLACANQIVVDTVTVTVITPPFSTTVSNDTTNCITPISIGVGTQNTIAGMSYTWSTGETTKNITVNPLTTTIYTVTSTDCSYFSIVDTIRVQVNNDTLSLNSPSIDSTQIQCPGDATLLQTQISGGYTPYTISWPTGKTSTDTFETIYPYQSNNYVVSVSDVCNLYTITDTIEVHVPNYAPIQIISLTDTSFDCPFDQVIYGSLIGNVHTSGGAGTGYVFSWNNFTDTNSTLIVYPSIDTLLTVQATDVCADDTAKLVLRASLNQFASLDIQLINDTHICKEDQIYIPATLTGGAGGYSMVWNNGQTSANTAIDSVLVNQPQVTTLVQVTATDKCEDVYVSDSMLVIVEHPEAIFSHNYLPRSNEIKFNNFSEGAISYIWNFGNEDTSSVVAPIYTFVNADSTFVTLLAINKYGCTDLATTLVDPPLYYYIPNAFTPGQTSGINDKFFIVGSGFREIGITVYNRWGEKVFDGVGPTVEWDGTHKGQVVPAGNYVVNYYIIGENGRYIEDTSNLVIF